MEIRRRAVAGTLESGDAFVEIEPLEAGIAVEVQSAVYVQFGQAIRDSVCQTLADLEITGAKVYVNDRGALDWTIRARVEAAAKRAAHGEVGL